MPYTTQDIVKILGAELLPGGTPGNITQILTDSRKINRADTSLFFAIKGERHNGHRFISALAAKGVKNFVVSELPENPAPYPGINFILVEDTLAAMQRLCSHHRKQFSISVIGITGSNGKTVVKEWLYQLLHSDKNIVRSPRSFNSQVGVPLSVWQMNAEHELAVFEAGISRPGEMEKLEKIISPAIGILTNIGQAHDENFSGIIQKIQEKLKLFLHSEILIYCRDFVAVQEQLEKSNEFKGLKTFTWSKRTNANLQVTRIQKDSSGTGIRAVFRDQSLEIHIPFTDEASVENAIHCWALMLYLGYDNTVIAGRMKALAPVAMRMEMKEGINHCTVINDSYNSDLGSLAVALDFLEQQKQHSSKTVILSDILQSGKNEESLYREVAGLLESKKINRLIGIGEAISRQAVQFSGEKIFFKSTTDFLEKFSTSRFQDEAILIKGARAFGFESISKLLQQKAHETVLEINLTALANNLNYFRSKLKPGTKIMAMVKAFSYGSGSYEIAGVLQFHRMDYLAVAYADEGVELRNAGITLPILVMNPEEHGFDAMLKHRLEPEIFSFRVLNLFSEAVRRKEYKGDPLYIHLKLDTGMHRLGFVKEEINELIVRVKNDKNLRVRSVFSHLAASEANEHDDFTRNQIRLFGEMSQTVLEHLEYPVLRHILNSAGTIRFPEAQYEMVRLGIGLYGFGSNDFEQSQLQNVSSLKTIISQIKDIPAGETVGYNRKGIANIAMKIATVPIGYADGLSRKLGNGNGKMMVRGRFAPIIGNVCMDMCMIDITGIQADEGDEVILFGDNYPIRQLALDLQTIPYEVLTNVSRRVKRVYFQE